MVDFGQLSSEYDGTHEEVIKRCNIMSDKVETLFNRKSVIHFSR